MPKSWWYRLTGFCVVMATFLTVVARGFVQHPYPLFYFSFVAVLFGMLSISGIYQIFMYDRRSRNLDPPKPPTKLSITDLEEIAVGNYRSLQDIPLQEWCDEIKAVNLPKSGRHCNADLRAMLNLATNLGMKQGDSTQYLPPPESWNGVEGPTVTISFKEDPHA